MSETIEPLIAEDRDLDEKVWGYRTRLSQPWGAIAKRLNITPEEVVERWRRHNDLQSPSVGPDVAGADVVAKLEAMDTALAGRMAKAEVDGDADELRRSTETRLKVMERIEQARGASGSEGGSERLADFLGAVLAAGAKKLAEAQADSRLGINSGQAPGNIGAIDVLGALKNGSGSDVEHVDGPAS